MHTNQPNIQLCYCSSDEQSSRLSHIQHMLIIACIYIVCASYRYRVRAVHDGLMTGEEGYGSSSPYSLWSYYRTPDSLMSSFEFKEARVLILVLLSNNVQH